MKKMNIVLAFAGLMLLTSVVSAQPFWAGEEKPEMPEEWKEKMEERNEIREAALAALEAGDYEAWVAALSVGDHYPPILEKITEENFDRLVRLHELMVEVMEIREEIGLETPGRPFFKRMIGFFQSQHAPGQMNGQIGVPQGKPFAQAN